jgi:hypothetical protein
MKRLLLTLIIIVGLLDGCKKYEDGPLISFHSAKSRLYGNFALTQYSVNDADSLDLYKDSLCINYTFGFDEQDNNYICTNIGIRNDGKFANVIYIWELKNKNKNLCLTKPYGNSFGTGPFGKDKTTEWIILRLSNKEFKLKINYNGKEYKVGFTFISPLDH